MRFVRTWTVLLASLSVSPLHAAGVRDDARAGRTSIVRDDFGIAHVHGRSDADAVFAMMYAQAEDDFPRIERNYLTALGRMAEADGESAVWQDLRQRLFIDPSDLRSEYRRSPRWLRVLMDGWAAGLNHYLATHPDVRPRVIDRFEPWMALAFSEGSIGGDIERGVELAALRAFYEGTKPPGLTDCLAAAGRLTEPKGSNGIAIGPSRSSNGHALLWINPHTSFFFRAEQQVTSDAGLNVYGAATWGQFFVYQGFNRHVGWMHTSSGVDTIDEFAVEVARRGKNILSYRYGREWRPVRQHVVTLRVRRADWTLTDRRFTVLSTHHGPIIRSDNGRWIAVAMLNAPRAALEQSYLRTKAANLADYLRVGDRKANSSNNTIFAGDDGTIAYLHPQFVPIRNARFDYTRPVNGSDPATDWKGLHRLDQLPSAVTPATGWVMNTNNAPWGAAGHDSPRAADFPRYMDQFGENPRGIHATRLLTGTTKFTVASLTATAFDPFLPLFDQQIPGLRRAYTALGANDPRRARLKGPLALLERWDRRWGVTSEPTSLAVYWGEAMWGQEGPKAAAANIPLFTWFAERMTDADRISAFDRAVAAMTRDFGSWRIGWGRINRLQRISGDIVQRFDDRRPSVPVGFTSGNFGSLAAFSVERQPGQRCLYGTTGNSFVAAVEFGPQVRAWAVSVGGESGDPASPHFDDQSRRYADGALRPIMLTPEDLRSFAARRYRPGDTRPGDGPRSAGPAPIGTGHCLDPQ